MKKYCLLLLAFCAFKADAQKLTQYLTHVPDTSYNTLRDYRQNLKNYPFIKIVPDSPVTTVKEQRGLVYAKIGERELHIDAFTPAAKSKPTPALIIIHGGGWRSGNRSQHIPLAQRLAAKGTACFTVEYRLSTEAFYPAAVYDVKAAIRWMRANAKKFNIDPKKFAVAGFSAGGQLAALTGVTNNFKKLEGDEGVTNQSSSVQAVVDIDGTLSFVHPEAWETQNVNNVNASAWWLGYPRTERLDLWTEASPFTYAKENTTPFIFLNSSVERMHAGRDDFKKLMDEKGVYTEIVNFKDSPHGFCLYYPWFNDVVKDIDAFLKKVLK